MYLPDAADQPSRPPVNPGVIRFRSNLSSTGSPFEPRLATRRARLLES